MGIFFSSKVNSTGTTVPTINQSTTNQNDFLRDLQGFITIAESLQDISKYIMLVVSVTGVLTNSLLILVVLIDPLKQLRTAKSTVIIVSLSLADLLTSSVALFYFVPAIQLSERALLIRAISLWFGFSASLLNLFVFTFERFIVTLYPLRAKLIISYRRTAFACLTSWIVGAAIAVTGQVIEEPLTHKMFHIVQVGFFEFLVVLMVVLNIRIILSIRKHTSQMNGELFNKESNKALRKMNTVLSTLIILFIITTMPYLITRQVWNLLVWCQMSSFGCLPCKGSTIFKLSVFLSFFLPFGMINFLVNPIVYGWRLDIYRASALALFSKELRRRGSSTT